MAPLGSVEVSKEGADHRLPLHTAGLRVSGLSGGALGSPPRVSVRPGDDRASEGPTGGRVATPRSPGFLRFCVVPQPDSGVLPYKMAATLSPSQQAGRVHVVRLDVVPVDAEDYGGFDQDGGRPRPADSRPQWGGHQPGSGIHRHD
ncbi:hypothetical protein NDU88_002612 [Pleurodeles waltl]|uniref:Uncharacterized protein n=1 Tax=Pleurodeles waltl TaxID=8319 RepID=A0AAV7P9K0_PLEWA|nr:hypothetical protein NDU88_002612 [Pleurodeles waltl]